MNKNSKIAFIGGGNMATSIIAGLLANGVNASQLYVSDPNAEQTKKLQERFNVHIFSINQEAAESADVVVLAVKPQVCQPTVESIKTALGATQPLVISILAGIRISSIQDWAGIELPVIRSMPNTPALVNEGLTGLYANALCSNTQKQFADALMQSIGQTIWVDEESTLDVVTGISGTGPAYFFKLIEIMIDVAQRQGIAPDIAQKMVLQTAFGATKLAINSKHSPTQLRQQVTSPGGTTQAAIEKMEQNNINNAIESGILAAINRAQELAKHEKK